MTLSSRLATVLNQLPLEPGMRVLEIGCGPGALARAMAAKLERGFVLGIDRSAKAVAQAESGSADEIKSGRLAFRKATIEDFALVDEERPFDLAVAVRVGALDGRHPEAGARAMRRLAAVLQPAGRLFVDGREVPLD